MGILDACELHCFPPEVARVFENAIERLFYLDHFRVGGATLPRSRVRVVIPDTEMWEQEQARPDFVLQNMVGRPSTSSSSRWTGKTASLWPPGVRPPGPSGISLPTGRR